jgi:hypothetical protein
VGRPFHEAAAPSFSTHVMPAEAGIQYAWNLTGLPG